MRVFFTGGTGIFGRPLVAALSQAGHDVTVLTRNARAHEAMGTMHRVVLEQGDLTRSGAWQRAIDGADVVVHFGGTSLVGQPLTPQRVSELSAARKAGAIELFRGFSEARKRPRALVLTSGVGIYGEVTDLLDERWPLGSGAIAQLFRVSEAITVDMPQDVTVTRLRLGQVISRRAPLVSVTDAQRLPPPDDTPFSWVHVHDAVAVAKRVIEQPYRGALNVCAPKPTDVAGVYRALGAEAPKRGRLSKVFGGSKKEALVAPAVLLTGQRALPTNVEAMGYSFRFEALEAAVRDARNAKR
jgi:NAD dependent epimerase/dehydratase family enzyme